jgi:hypothetical protein
MGLPFTSDAGPRQRSHSSVRVPRNSWSYFTVTDSRLPLTWRDRSPYLYPPGAGWPSYTPRHWVGRSVEWYSLEADHIENTASSSTSIFVRGLLPNYCSNIVVYFRNSFLAMAVISWFVSLSLPSNGSMLLYILICSLLVPERLHKFMFGIEGRYLISTKFVAPEIGAKQLFPSSKRRFSRKLLKRFLLNFSDLRRKFPWIKLHMFHLQENNGTCTRGPDSYVKHTYPSLFNRLPAVF